MTEQEIFSGAFDRPDPADRARYLDETCGPDSVLRARVTRLLDLAAAPDPILDAPPVPPLPREFAAGAVVADRYRLIEPFGEGAMGVVWRAEQTDPVRREVALKVLHPEYDAGPVLARFEAERHVLGRMDHPNIATIFDAGTTPEGRRFFALEAIRGRTITRYCADQNLGVEARIILFIAVCRAVQHAHQKGVIHRDIKPGNILVAEVDGAAVPKVIDFGVAKSVGLAEPGNRLTRLGSVVGTPQYMSPEQAELSNPDVDTRSDVYSLGAALYELLTGNPPVASERVAREPLLEILRAIREEAPPNPSACRPRADTLPAARWRELDTIVRTCLAKDREQRYASAEALADDLSRFLADQPLQACPPSTWYRVSKFVRRNRGRVLLAAMSLLLLTAGAVGTTIGFVRASRAAKAEADHRAIAERDRAAKERAAGEAEAHLLTARRALAHLNRLATEYSFEPRMEATWRNLLRDSTQFFLELHAARPDDPAVRLEMGQTFARLGMAYRRLGDTGEALRSFARGIELLDGLATASALDPTARILLVKTYHHYGWELSVANRRPDRVVAHRKALAQAERIAVELPDPRHRDLLADSCSVLGTTLVPADPTEAEALFARATQLLSGTGANQHHLGTAWLALGELQKDNPGGRADAEKALRRAIEVLTPVVAKNALAWQSRDRLADARVHLGRVLAADGRMAEAIDELRAALVVRDKQAADFKSVPAYRDDQFVARVELARALAVDGRGAEARTEFEGLAPHPPQGAAACTALAWLLAGCPDPAVRNPRRAVESARQAVALAPEFAAHWRALGAAHFRNGNPAEAVRALAEALARRPAGNGFDLFYLALAHERLGDRAAALPWYTKATAWADRHAPKDRELARLRAEVAALLGFARGPEPPPAVGCSRREVPDPHDAGAAPAAFGSNVVSHRPIPDTGAAVEATRRDAVVVPVGGHAGHGLRRARERLVPVARVGVPHLHGLIDAARA